MSSTVQKAKEDAKVNSKVAQRNAKQALGDPQKGYLLVYNAASALLWSSILYFLINHISSPSSTFSLLPNSYLSPLEKISSRASTTYSSIGLYTKWIQTLAILEVAHVASGLVRSSLQTTAMQVSSRLFLVWVILEKFPVTQGSPVYASMVLAWSVTEVIRYTHYATGLLGIKSKSLEWLRYTTFYPLYPLGALSEAFLIYTAIPYARAAYGEIGFYGGFALVIFWPFALALMMTHMHKQRSKHVGGGGRSASSKEKKRA